MRTNAFMFLWLQSSRKAALLNHKIKVTAGRNILPGRRTVMTIRRLSKSSSSVQRALKTSRKEIHTPRNDYDELNDLLSDSDGWEDDIHVERVTPVIKNGVQSSSAKVRNEFSDADDSMICELLQSKKIGKSLAGASSEPFRHYPPRNSFSSHTSDGLRRPIVESTQQGDLYATEDSRLLLSLLRGEDSSRISENHNAISKGNTTKSELEQAGVSLTLGTKDLEENFLLGELDEREVAQNIPESGTVLLNDIRNEDQVKIALEEVQDVKPSNVSRSIDIVSEPEGDRSFEIVEEPERVQYAEKFALLTQRPGLQSTQELEKRLKLNPKVKIIVPVRLSKEQEDVLRLAEAGHNIFYTGSAGSGKSVLLRELIKILKKKYGDDQVAVTASTGLAACNIGGVTVHSFAGVGLGNGEVTKLYRKVRRSRKHMKRWESVSALVIDEISMLDGELLDKMDFIAQKIRKNRKPFGDIQLIFCGDFFQLPPVSKDNNNPTKFAFESSLWKEGIDMTILLTKVFRQQGDTKFIEMLNKMRLGQIDAETEREFKKLNRPLPQDEIIPAELYSTRSEVERANYSRLSRLPGKAHIFHAIDGGALEDRELREKLLQNFLAPKELQLKIGAQVMMIKNIDATLVNGSLGKVIDFIDPETYMFYETIIRNPDLPAESLTKLKDNPELLKETWAAYCEDEDNDTPVRQKTIKDAFCKNDPEESVAQLGESIFDFLKDQSTDDSETRENLERKRELLRQVHESSKAKRKLPLVRFKTSDLSTRTILVEPESWAIEDDNEKSLVSRVQLPLMLAWSLSIHKSQGQTLPKVKVDLRRVFEKGQAYVALSRAVSREGLQVLNFDKSRIKAHQKVVDFYSTLVTAEHAIKQLDPKVTTSENNKRRKTEPEPNVVLNQRRTRQARSRSKSQNAQSGIAAMLLQRANGNQTNVRRNRSLAENLATIDSTEESDRHAL